MRNERPPLYRWRDAWISDAGPASSTTRLVLHTLATHMYADFSGSCRPGSRTLARESGLARPTVLKHLKRARDEGWINWEDETGEGVSWRSRTYMATYPSDWKGDDGGPPVSADGRTVKEPNQPSQGRGERGLPPSGDEIDARGGQTRGNGGQPDAAGRSNSGRGVVSESYRRMFEDVEEVEDGNQGAEGSSLRSSPSGSSPGVENSQCEKGQHDSPTREQLLQDDRSSIAAWILPLHRNLLYSPDGRPPDGYDDSRDVSCYRDLLERGHQPETIERSLEGLAYARDRGQVPWLEPGEKVTARALRARLPGGLNALVKFADLGRRLRAGELHVEAGSTNGPEALSDVLARIAGLGGTAVPKEEGP